MQNTQPVQPTQATQPPGRLQLEHNHRWNVTTREARAIQLELAARVSLHKPAGFLPRLAAGVDVGFENGGAVTRAAVVVLDIETLLPVDCAIARRPTQFPYVPGLLSFREIPAVLEALAQLEQYPDVLLCDGQGIAHPRRLGIAAHLGVLTGLPSAGIAKSLLIGSHDPVPEIAGQWTPLRDGDEVIGAVLRSRAGCKPLIVSAGHRLDLDTAIALTRRCVTRYRLPETTRWADGIASRKLPVMKRLPDALRQRLAPAPAPA